MKYRLILAFALVMLLLITTLGQAHNVSVFAVVEEDTVTGETYFSGGKPAKHSSIVVLRGDTEEELLSLQTDEQGRFSFPIPAPALREGFDLKIVLLAGEAHRNEWLIRAAEFLTPETAAPKTRPAPTGAPGVGDVFAGLGFILGGGVLIWLFRKKKRESNAH